MLDLASTDPLPGVLFLVPGVIKKPRLSFYAGTDWLEELHTPALLHFEHVLVHTLQCVHFTFTPPLSKIKTAAGTTLNKKRDQSSYKKCDGSQQESRISLKLLYKEPEAKIGLWWVSICEFYSTLKFEKKQAKYDYYRCQ